MEIETNNKQVHVIYIHGIAKQKEGFADKFHKNVVNQIKKERPEVDNINERIVSHPFYWFKYFEERLKNYKKVTTPSKWKRYIFFYGIMPLDLIIGLYLLFFGFNLNPFKDLANNWLVLGLMVAGALVTLCFILYGMLNGKKDKSAYLRIFWWLLLSFFIFYFSYISFGLELIDPQGSTSERIVFILVLGVLGYFFLNNVSQITKIQISDFVDPLALETIWYSRSWIVNEELVVPYEKELIYQILPASEPDKKKGRIRVHDFLMQKLLEEIKTIPETDDIVIVGHSLGSVIAFDYIFNNQFKEFRKTGRVSMMVSPSNLRAFVSMGSPIPIFAQALGPIDEVSNLMLPTTAKWFNLYNIDDPIARRCRIFFDTLTERDLLVQVKVDTGLLLFAHTQYWKRPIWRRFLSLFGSVGLKGDPSYQTAKIVNEYI